MNYETAGMHVYINCWIYNEKLFQPDIQSLQN